MNNSAEAEKIKIVEKWISENANMRYFKNKVEYIELGYAAELLEAYHQHRMKEILSALTDEVIRGMFPGEFMDYVDAQEAKRKGAKALRDYLKQKQ